MFGALINLTVRVDAYFHPIRITYPIQPGPFFRTAPNWRKPAKHFLFLRTLQKGQNRASVFEWHKRFQEGRESVRDDERCGRSKEVNSPELISQKVRVRVTMLRF